jgi:NAD-reducing hydrogenase large subunit
MNDSVAAAAEREGLRRVAIDPLSRVEGHGKVTLLVDKDDRITQVRLHIVEFRGFERFIEGRPFWEIPVMVQRLCGICPVSHQIAAAKALDVVVGARELPPAALRLRRLMHYGQILQSHALHFFHLASPDLLFGFDADPKRRNFFAVAEEAPEIARRGIMLRRYGQQVIEATGGKRIHGTGATPGGMNKGLSAAERAALLRDADTIVGWSVDAVATARGLLAGDPARTRDFAAFESNLMGLVAADGSLDLYDGNLRVCGPDGTPIYDGVSAQRYGELIGEEVRPWTYMKFPFLRALGTAAGWYRVGPLARLQICDRIGTPRAEAERQQFIESGGGRQIGAALAIHWARMIEMLHAAETVRALLDDEAILDTDLTTRGTRVREGVGILEAPRGTLIHHYRVGDDDLIEYCNLIVSTTHNNQAMHEAIRSVAQHDLDGRRLTEALLNRIEVAIRAYDPCLSCATHALGRMPLDVTLLGPEGELRDRVRRDEDGFVHEGGAA